MLQALHLHQVRQRDFNNAVQNEGDDDAAGGGWKRGFRVLYSHDAVLTPLGSTHIDFGPNDVWKD
jgi:hypothetical protein